MPTYCCAEGSPFPPHPPPAKHPLQTKYVPAGYSLLFRERLGSWTHHNSHTIGAERPSRGRHMYPHSGCTCAHRRPPAHAHRSTSTHTVGPCIWTSRRGTVDITLYLPPHGLHHTSSNVLRFHPATTISRPAGTHDYVLSITAHVPAPPATSLRPAALPVRHGTVDRPSVSELQAAAIDRRLCPHFPLPPSSQPAMWSGFARCRAKDS